jgi:hypothetical protein
MIFERFSRKFRDFHTDKTVFTVKILNKSFQKFKEVSKMRGASNMGGASIMERGLPSIAIAHF